MENIQPFQSMKHALCTRIAKQQIAQGINPAAAKQEAKQECIKAAQNTFHNIVLAWYEAKLHRWKDDNAQRIFRQLESDVLPYIASKQIDALSVSQIKSVLDRITQRDALSTAEKVRQWIGAIFDYAAMLEMMDRNSAHALKTYLPKVQTQHRQALPAAMLQEFYYCLELGNIEAQNKIAIMLLMLVFVRNTELRAAQWEEIDFQVAGWTIPVARMKHEKTKPKPLHKILLADWTLELLQELHKLTGDTPFLFPIRTNANACISEAILMHIVGRLGYKGILNEQGFNVDAIEWQLAHVENNAIRAVYNRADY
ncbi:tyrosine-type recombinase/integrase [Neisseriaceae bacterium B1]